MQESKVGELMVTDPTPRPATRPVKSVLGAGRGVLRRIEALLCLISASALLIPVTDNGCEGPPVWNPGHGVAVGLILLSSYATYRRVRGYLHAESDRDSAVAREARLQGLALAANTFRHHLGNKLAITVGFSEMLADDPRLPAEIHAQAEKILSSAMAAAETMHALDAGLVDVQLDTTVAGPQILNLSTANRHTHCEPTTD